MAFTVTARGNVAENSSDTTFGVVPSANFGAGPQSFAVLFAEWDNSATLGADPFQSVTDTKGNTWTQIDRTLNDPGAANAGCVAGAFYTDQAAGTLTTGDTVTLTLTVNTPIKCLVLVELNAASGNTPQLIPTSHSATTYSSTGSTITTAASVNVAEVTFGYTGIQHTAALTADTDATNGSWVAQVTSTAGTTTSGGRVSVQWKIQTTTASTQTYNTVIGGTTHVGVIGYAVFREVAQTVTGTLAQTTANATSAASGSEVTGTLAQTTAASTNAGTGGHGPSGTLAQTTAAATVAASGGHGPSGSVAQTTAASTSAGAGSTVTGTLARTTAASTSSASGGTGPSGSLAQTTADATSAASGASGAAGSLALTTADATSSASGGTGAAGTLAVSTDASTSTAAGSSTTGTLTTTTADATSAANGTVGAGGATGTLDVVLADATLSGAGSSVVGTVIGTTDATANASGTASAPDVHLPASVILTVSDPWSVDLAVTDITDPTSTPPEVVLTVSDIDDLDLGVVDISDPTPVPASVTLTVSDLDDLELAVTNPWAATLTVRES